MAVASAWPYASLHLAPETNLDDAGTVRPNESRLVLLEHAPLHTDHVLLRNAFRYRDNQTDLGVDGLQDSGGGGRRRDVDHRSITLRCRFRLHPPTFTYTRGDVTSRNPWSRYGRHVVGITRHDVCS